VEVELPVSLAHPHWLPLISLTASAIVGRTIRGIRFHKALAQVLKRMQIIILANLKSGHVSVINHGR
jgi:hypothetical protein